MADSNGPAPDTPETRAVELLYGQTNVLPAVAIHAILVMGFIVAAARLLHGAAILWVTEAIPGMLVYANFTFAGGYRIRQITFGVIAVLSGASLIFYCVSMLQNRMPRHWFVWSEARLQQRRSHFTWSKSCWLLRS